MEYQIKRGNEVVLTIRPTGGGVQKGIMNANLVRFDFETDMPADLQRGDYLTVYRENFYLNRLPEFTKDDKAGWVKYTYNCIFESVTYNLGKTSYRFLDANNQFTTGEFTLTGTLDVFIDLLIRNANRTQSGWMKGVVDLTETKTISFSSQKCLEVLAVLATEFNTEWWVEGQVVHMTKKGKPSGLSLEYGKDKGLYSLQRRNVPNANAVNRLYVQGGTKNLPGSYRNYSRRLQLPETTGAYLEKNVGPDGIIEHDLIFDDIYPNRIGTITAVTDKYTFADTTLDFDVNESIIPGVDPKIVFNTGPLAGYEFVINNFNNEGKVFTINHNEDEKALPIPSELIHAEPGDRYVLIGINMPQSYVDLAEAELQQRAQAYLDKNSVDRFIYAGEQDPLHFKRAGIVLRLGDYIELKDTQLGVNVTPRIVSYERDLHDPYYYPNVEFSEHVDIPALVRQYAEQDKVNKAVLKSDLVKPNPTVQPVKTPVRKEIVFNPGFVSYYQLSKDSDTVQPPAVYWKDNNMVYMSGWFMQNKPMIPYSPFTLPLGFRPWYDAEAKCPVKVYVGLFPATELWGTLTVKQNGEVFITATWGDGRPVEPNTMVYFDLSGCSFYTGMG